MKRYFLLIVCLMSNQTFTMKKNSSNTLEQMKKCKEETDKISLAVTKRQIGFEQAQTKLDDQQAKLFQLSYQMCDQIKKESEEQNKKIEKFNNESTAKISVLIQKMFEPGANFQELNQQLQDLEKQQKQAYNNLIQENDL